MNQFLVMSGVQASLFIYLAVGYLMQKLGVITQSVRGGITNLLVMILLPCMVFNSFHQEISAQKMISAAAILAVAFALSFFAWFVGWLIYRRYPQEKASILRYGTLVANSGFAGLPVIQSAYGATGLFYASIFIIPNRIFMWSTGVSMFQKGKSCNWVRDVLLNPGIIAVELGLARMLLKIRLPGFVDTAVAGMGNCTTAISIIVVGSILAEVDLKSIFSKDALFLSFVRLIFLPGCALIALKATGFERLATAVAVVLTGMPIGSTTAILGEKYGADASFASKCVFVTTLLSLFTIPIFTFFL
ncbi:AEC family transporter [Caproiciproducens sp. AGMB10547]|uniref:AEC family transporter n=2 Tax=Caproiciproducens faecalis TaxID=2820301 RepID=A0ABS7DM58_9FIRM|nr:AEC family transporter [Caproiciproducens faecalis]